MTSSLERFDLQTAIESIDKTEFKGLWADKLWPNTPGPFYGADTDSCGTGPLQAPYNSGFDTNGFEYIFKQPSTVQELNEVIKAAAMNVLSGYACDGDAHWTISLIQEWWKQRHELLRLCLSSPYLAPELVDSPDTTIRIYRRNARYRLQYVRSELAGYLSWYSFLVEEGRSPHETDTIPLYSW
jgi:hypothetical protein